MKYGKRYKIKDLTLIQVDNLSDLVQIREGSGTISEEKLNIKSDEVIIYKEMEQNKFACNIIVARIQKEVIKK